MEKISIAYDILNELIRRNFEGAINIYNTYKDLINWKEARFNLCNCTNGTMLDAYLYKRKGNDEKTINWLIDQQIEYTLKHNDEIHRECI